MIWYDNSNNEDDNDQARIIMTIVLKMQWYSLATLYDPVQNKNIVF